YAVRIGSNLLPTLGTEAKAAGRSPKVALVTDENVARHYLDPAMESLRAAGLQVETAVLGAGEASKTLEGAGELYDRMLRAGLDRGSVVVGLGGGVVTDLAGFVAATYMRGIAWVGVSTSLLGQVDASVGGKTGVDHPECKNLIGAFHQPSAVLADVTTLATLPEEELRTGLAEVVKHALIRDAALFDTLEAKADAILAREPEVLENVVARNVEIKADVVMADEREGGLRRILNYGHTVGHALESLAMEAGGRLGGAAVTHGRAVALGMMAEARIAQARGTADAAVVERQRELLERFGLPVRLDAAPNVDRCLAIMRHDKKARSGRLRFILPEEVGTVRDVDDVTDDEIRDALRSLAADG
ncbi:MAG TPA: 3-dehydroquinate synthase, partial [Phycisphaerae bacterium]|nr:3-dehydroquinate synthase [Phycisphaerae bacterium]